MKNITAHIGVFLFGTIAALCIISVDSQTVTQFPQTLDGTQPSQVYGATGLATSADPGMMSAADKAKMDSYPSYVAKVYTNNASRTIQTVAAAANGWQLSSTREAIVSYSASVTTTATIGGSGAGYIVLEICSTNSATAANWQEIGRITNSQTITLAVALNSVQIIGAQLSGVVPVGYYARLRSVVSAGTVSFSYVSGQEVVQ